MPEQHRVGDRAEEQRADQQTRGGERVRTARELCGCEQTGEAEQRSDEVEDGRELGSALAGFRAVVAADHRRHTRAPFGLDFLPAAHARTAPNNGDEQRDTGRDDAQRGRHCRRGVVVRNEQRERTDREHAVDDPHQPAVSEADLTSAAS